MRMRFIDGCYIDIDELENGMVEMVLLSPYRTGFLARSPREPYEYDEIVSEAIVSKDQVFNQLAAWADY